MTCSSTPAHRQRAHAFLVEETAGHCKLTPRLDYVSPAILKTRSAQGTWLTCPCAWHLNITPAHPSLVQFTDNIAPVPNVLTVPSVPGQSTACPNGIIPMDGPVPNVPNPVDARTGFPPRQPGASPSCTLSQCLLTRPVQHCERSLDRLTCLHECTLGYHGYLGYQ